MTTWTRTTNRRGERGNSLLEFTFVSSIFIMMLVGIAAGSNLYFTHNALVEVTRRGAHFASTQAAATPAGTVTTGTNVGPSLTSVRNYALYGNSAGTGSKVISNLEPANIDVTYANFGVGQGTVTVTIVNYNYYFVLFGSPVNIPLPTYQTTAGGESAGTTP